MSDYPAAEILNPTLQLKFIVDALKEIACYWDRAASEHFVETGSYEMFEEPISVQKARWALEVIGDTHWSSRW